MDKQEVLKEICEILGIEFKRGFISGGPTGGGTVTKPGLQAILNKLKENQCK